MRTVFIFVFLFTYQDTVASEHRILNGVSSVLTEQSHGHDVAGTWSLQGKNAYAGISVHELKAGSITEVFIEQW
jgi:hypothetical protein